MNNRFRAEGLRASEKGIGAFAVAELTPLAMRSPQDVRDLAVLVHEVPAVLVLLEANGVQPGLPFRSCRFVQDKDGLAHSRLIHLKSNV
jgi:hypothetical protein